MRTATPAAASRALPGWLAALTDVPPRGQGTILAAGPCSVTGLDMTLRVAATLAEAGATWLRGGAFKPRSSPHLFRGLGHDGLRILAEARALTGLPIVTEILDVRDLEPALPYADVIQIGARNMQNYPLLTEVGRTDHVVLLKRHFSATIDEVIGALDYIRAEGNTRVILCERGIRTFEPAYRFTLDVSAVPVLQERSGQPVFVDPSHAAGRRDLVLALSKAAVGVGADGLLVEVDEEPEEALSDRAQQLRSDEFAVFAQAIARNAGVEGRPLVGPPRGSRLDLASSPAAGWSCP